jgi:hypothetical protein
MRVIAHHLNRRPSTLYREINRNWLHDEEPLYRYPLHFGLAPHRGILAVQQNLIETSPIGFTRQGFVYADNRTFAFLLPRFAATSLAIARVSCFTSPADLIGFATSRGLRTFVFGLQR